MTDRILAMADDPEAAYDAAADAVAAGQVIVLPTDTVYGVGADAINAEAVQRLLDAKQRGRDFPPPVLVAEVPMIRALAEGVDERVTALAGAFWPGALTLVLRSAPNLRMDLGDRGDTIAVRVPDHDLTRELLRRTGPLAVSSANVHGQPAALTAQDAAAQLGDAVAVYLDAGPGTGPLASTIVDLTGTHARVLREGRITVADLNAVVPRLIEPDEPDEPEEPGGSPGSPEPARADGNEDGSA
ncbi:MAG: threonylcarbamoyl-AMP synthase [Propionibacteriaceae bacterium]|nr:threonylcarbamoyl-AMP synthase [Propionibacteriaceae bacterium]